MLKENMIDYIMETYSLTKEDADIYLSTVSFKEYVSLVEAQTVVPTTVGQFGTGQPNQPAPAANTQASNTQTPNAATSPVQPNNIPNQKQGEFKIGDIVSAFDDAVNGLSDGEVTQVDQQKGMVQVKDKNGKVTWLDKKKLQPSDNSFDGSSSIVNTIKTQFNKGRQMMKQSVDLEDQELRRIVELAGITEEATDGATSAGQIAICKSVIGDSNHRPTETLSKAMRLKRLKVKK
jgi:hypothetical protein